MSQNNTTFKISYDGPALAGHEMNVRDFAPALLAIGDLLDEANLALNGSKTKVVVNIKATEAGSIDVLLSVVQDIFTQAQTLFSGDGINAFLNARDLLIILLGIKGGSFGVINTILWLKNRPIKNITKIEVGKFKITVTDGDTRVVTENEIRLFGMIKIRKSLEAIIKTPLEKEGINKVTFSDNETINTNIIQEIEKEQIEFFDAPKLEEELIDQSEIEANLQIINISFLENGKWRFSDGNATFYAEISDADFVGKIKNNEEVFAKDDILKVKMDRKQYLSDGAIKTDYEITKILNHRSAAIQIKLPFE